MNRKEPTDCSSIEELREQIDAIDGEIIDLLAKRWTYVDQVWRTKVDSQVVSVPKRIETMLEKARQRAEASGLPVWVAEALWKEVIRLGVAYEKQQLDSYTKARRARSIFPD